MKSRLQILASIYSGKIFLLYYLLLIFASCHSQDASKIVRINQQLDKGVSDKVMVEAQILFGEYLNKANLMPRITLEETDSQGVMQVYMEYMHPAGFQIRLESESSDILHHLPNLRSKGMNVCISTLWPENSASHDDDKAIWDQEEHWGWHIKNGINIFNTDRPAALLQFLHSENIRLNLNNRLWKKLP